MLIRKQRAWQMPEREATEEKWFLSRRDLIASLGCTVAAGFGLNCSDSGDRPDKDFRGNTVDTTFPPARSPYPLKRNARYTIDRPLTDPRIAGSYNNFYEFGSEKANVWKRTANFQIDPWTVEIGGLVHKPKTFSVAELLRIMPAEERIYRLRCVEAWSMAVPWSGFPLHALLKQAEPMSKARFVRFVGFNKAEQAPGIKEQPWYRWPYYEGLRLDEAMNELTMLVTGVYGRPLPKQHGAPIRLIVPWKYGYKSAKAITRIELIEQQPHTFWEDMYPAEYTFESNVDPRVPHPRWSQANERLIGTQETRKTLLHNGYGEFVAGMYG